jgi:TonB-dependent SusC/RagA subfamily outer membrane receptor
MKHSTLLFLLTLGLQMLVCGQPEKDIRSVIDKVIVYKKGAQIERSAAFDLTKGKTILNFTNLSPNINIESIRVDGDGNYAILNVQQQNDYLNRLAKNSEIGQLNNDINELQNKIEDEETWIKIINDKITFLKTNQVVAGKEQAVNPETFKSLNAIYGSNLESLTLEILRRQRLIRDYKDSLNDLNSQLSTKSLKKDVPSGTIIITIDSKLAGHASIRFSYLVDNAEWYPSYDIHYNGTEKPLTVIYKATVSQNTGIDWKEVSLVLSSAKTNISAKIPELYPFFLSFYTPPLTSRNQDQSGLPGITGNSGDVKIRGISSANTSGELLYVVDGVPMKDISGLNNDEVENIEILKDASANAIYGSSGANGVVLITTKKGKSSLPSTRTTKQETFNEYRVDALQTILSSDQENTISFRESELEAVYEYQAIPKLSENVYLVALIPDWYKAELMDGAVNAYLENSYIEKTNIHAEQFKDTMDISFGVDNNISVHREKMKTFSENQLIGSNRKVTLAFKLTIRNNKVYPVAVKMYDQIPLSTTKEIEVEALELSGGTKDDETGMVTWDVTLKPNETKEFLIKYSVKFPKGKKVIIE